MHGAVTLENDPSSLLWSEAFYCEPREGGKSVATVKETFKVGYQGNKNASVADVAFVSGEEVKVLKEWGNETCLVRKGDGKVFNVPKTYLNL